MISLCPHCHCMTKNIRGKCGKCKQYKECFVCKCNLFTPLNDGYRCLNCRTTYNDKVIQLEDGTIFLKYKRKK